MRFFGFGVLCVLRVFSNLVFGFRFLSTIMVVLWIFLSCSFYGFSGFVKEVTPCNRTKIVILRDLLYSILPRLSFRGMHDRPCLFSSCYLCGNGCQADFEKPTITSKQKTISQISCAGTIDFL